MISLRGLGFALRAGGGLERGEEQGEEGEVEEDLFTFESHPAMGLKKETQLAPLTVSPHTHIGPPSCICSSCWCSCAVFCRDLRYLFTFKKNQENGSNSGNFSFSTANKGLKSHPTTGLKKEAPDK